MTSRPSLSAILIGADGFLGARLRDALGRHDIVAVGRRSGALRGDLRDDAFVDLVCQKARGATVLYCANVGGRRVADLEPDDAHRVNATVPGVLARASERFVYFSTDYIFSEPGQWTSSSEPSPRGIYATSKARGERLVLAGSRRPLVIRLSGLYDGQGTRDARFGEEGAFEAADDQFGSPANVDDVIAATIDLVRTDARGIRHATGPTVLSRYEFMQIASFAKQSLIRPVLSTTPRIGVSLRADVPGIRAPGPSFVATWARERLSERAPRRLQPTLVFDCVGVVLGGRTWRHPDPAYWASEDAGQHRQSNEISVDETAAAYAPNALLWRDLCTMPAATLVLANNGPARSFEQWVAKYGLDHLFDHVINSERDGVSKPSDAFFSMVERLDPNTGRKRVIIDDREEIIESARCRGWVAVRSKRTRCWPVEEYAYDRPRAAVS